MAYVMFQPLAERCCLYAPLVFAARAKTSGAPGFLAHIQRAVTEWRAGAPVVVQRTVLGARAGGGVGAGVVTTKSVALLTVPLAVVTLILPLLARAGTPAWIWVAESMVKLVAVTPLNLTAMTLTKFDPLIVTSAPTGPLAGVKPLIV